MFQLLQSIPGYSHSYFSFVYAISILVLERTCTLQTTSGLLVEYIAANPPSLSCSFKVYSRPPVFRTCPLNFMIIMQIESIRLAAPSTAWCGTAHSWSRLGKKFAPENTFPTILFLLRRFLGFLKNCRSGLISAHHSRSCKQWWWQHSESKAHSHSLVLSWNRTKILPLSTRTSSLGRVQVLQIFFQPALDLKRDWGILMIQWWLNFGKKTKNCFPFHSNYFQLK